MNSEYIKAIETRNKWLKWSAANVHVAPKLDYVPPESWAAYIKCLAQGELFFMNKKFCSLVDHARLSIPDDMTFDASWVQTRQGFLWIDEPFEVPKSIDDKDYTLKISAIGWLPITKVTELESGVRYGEYDLRSLESNAVAFMCFIDLSKAGDDTRLAAPDGYGCWSYFTIKHGEKLIDKVIAFEIYLNSLRPANGASNVPYGEFVDNIKLHEIRWIYTAFYLMAQRLSITFDEDVDRATRRRAEHDKVSVPPKIRVVSLRRLEQHKEKVGGVNAPVDWQWQWEVRGHWRNQWCRSTQTHKPLFIEGYIKGPEDKPLKPPGQKLFVAAR